ncbi:hypothetical protein [Polaromonas sp. CG9_12]|nr:hypothetical protein [Polaromonas sp. CG9_12]
MSSPQYVFVNRRNASHLFGAKSCYFRQGFSTCLQVFFQALNFPGKQT